MIRFGQSSKCFPMVVPTYPEIEKKTSEMTGYQCLSPDDWAMREAYINELEIRLNLQ